MPCSQIDPLPDTAKVWRYTDLARFVDLLRTGSLYLASLPTMEDEWEGATSAFREPWDYQPGLVETYGLEATMKLTASMENLAARQRQGVFINCWHRSEVESAAMWKLYEPTGRGIAIQTNIKRLRECVNDEKKVTLSEVQYVDFDDAGSLSLFDINRKYSYKRLSFSHEREVRLQYFDLAPLRGMTAGELAANPPVSERESNVDYEHVIDFETLPLGIHLDVDVPELVERVVVAPDAPPWFAEVIRDIVLRYGHNFSVDTSAMLHRPRYGHI